MILRNIKKKGNKISKIYDSCTKGPFCLIVYVYRSQLRRRQVKNENLNLRGKKNRREAKIESVHPIEGCRSARGFPVLVNRVYKFEVSWFSWCIAAVTEQQSTLALFARFLLPSAKHLKNQQVKRENVFLQRIVPKSGVFCHRWNNRGHIFKIIGMAKESEPARRTGWGKNNGSYTRSRWRRKKRGKTWTGIYSAKVSSRTRRTLRYSYERLLFTFFSQNLNRVHPCKDSLRCRRRLRTSALSILGDDETRDQGSSSTSSCPF